MAVQATVNRSPSLLEGPFTRMFRLIESLKSVFFFFMVTSNRCFFHPTPHGPGETTHVESDRKKEGTVEIVSMN